MWPIAYTLATSSSWFQSIVTPFLFFVYFIDEKYFVREKNSSFNEYDQTPIEGLPYYFANLWGIYRLLLLDDSFLREDYEATIDKNTFIDILLYSIAGNASGFALGLPNYFLSFITPQILIGIVLQ